MCGIIGEWGRRGLDRERFLVRRDLMSNRGPDDAGFFEAEGGALMLGHRRLSVLDLSGAGHQPMSDHGRVIVYNGEVYNFQDLKQGLGGDFSSHSDTEVILRAYVQEGLNVFSQLDGMFALAIYDPVRQVVVLARDRSGIKPLFYYQDKNRFVFASNIEALSVPTELNVEALQSFLFHNYIASQEEIWKGVRSVPPGHTLTFNLVDQTIKLEAYISSQSHPQQRVLGDSSRTLLVLHEALRHSVQSSLVSDVPWGVFLSSGVDSSLIAALAQEQAGEVHTFTVAFDHHSFDESYGAAAIAKKLGTQHHTITLDQQMVFRELPDILDSLDMPFGDSSAIPFYFLSRYARERVTVCLSGDGADELFGGYPLYYLPNISRFYRALPGHRWLASFAASRRASFNKLGWEEKLKRFTRGAAVDYRLGHALYRAMDQDLALKPEYRQFPDYFTTLFEAASSLPRSEQLMFVDRQTILPRDYLVKADRMSMAHGLEVRVPFLNNKVVSTAEQLPTNLKVRGLTTKYALKKILENYLPKELIYQPKRGFSVPMGLWLRAGLKDFMLETLSKNNIDKVPYLHYDGVSQLIASHLEGRSDYNRELWGLISLVRYLLRHL